MSTRHQTPSDSDLATAALLFARRVHRGQYREQTNEQFVQHPIAVATLLTGSGYGGAMVAAAYLHDVLEKTNIEFEQIRERFGPAVAELVESLTENPEILGYAERKRDLRRRIVEAGGDSVAIYAADRVANMRDWRKLAPEDRPACGERLGTTLEERLALWGEDVEELQYADPDVPFLHEMESELDALRAGLEAVDDVEKEDYEGVILPAVEKGSPSTARSGSSTCSATSSNDYEGEAVWGDIKLGARHPPRSSG